VPTISLPPLKGQGDGADVPTPAEARHAFVHLESEIVDTCDPPIGIGPDAAAVGASVALVLLVANIFGGLCQGRRGNCQVCEQRYVS
jgi:hypothetical protein